MVRDMGGLNGGLRRQIDAGVVIGPRIYSSGAFIGPSGGHSDFRNYSMPQDRGMSQAERLNIAVNTDGGASLFDPWQLNGLNEYEIRAAVQVANNYGSYVAAYSPMAWWYRSSS